MGTETERKPNPSASAGVDFNLAETPLGLDRGTVLAENNAHHLFDGQIERLKRDMEGLRARPHSNAAEEQFDSCRSRMECYERLKELVNPDAALSPIQARHIGDSLWSISQISSEVPHFNKDAMNAALLQRDVALYTVATYINGSRPSPGTSAGADLNLAEPSLGMDRGKVVAENNAHHIFDREIGALKREMEGLKAKPYSNDAEEQFDSCRFGKVFYEKLKDLVNPDAALSPHQAENIDHSIRTIGLIGSRATTFSPSARNAAILQRDLALYSVATYVNGCR